MQIEVIFLQNKTERLVLRVYVENNIIEKQRNRKQNFNSKKHATAWSWRPWRYKMPNLWQLF